MRRDIVKKGFKWLGILLVGLVIIVAVVALAGYLISERRIKKTYAIADEVLTLPTDASSLAEGQRLVSMRGCTDCHAADLGGKVLIDDAMLGSVSTANLTGGEGSATANYSVADWERAIRHGVGPDSLGLLIMPSYEFSFLSDEQLAQMIAYLQTAPPVDRVAAEPVLKPLSRALLLAGQLPLLPAELVDQDIVHVASMPAEASADYGAYLSTTCTGCHHPNLAGGPTPGSAPGAPHSANLTPAGNLRNWTLDDFKDTLRTGVTPKGKSLDPALMPWPITAQMTDVELEALWLYLKSLPSAVAEN
jgi:mono/diheme cytochrome c family protein